MTYPPYGQQPGQPGPYPQQGSFGQQPPSGFPHSGPQPQPGYPGAQQPDPWAQQPGYQGGQPDPWGQQPGAFAQFPGGEGAAPPKKKKTGLIIGIVVAVVVLVGGGVTALLLLTGGSGGVADKTADPKSLAQAAVETVNNRDAKGYAALVCTVPKQSEVDDLQKQWAANTDQKASVTGDPQITGTTAKVPVTVTINGKTRSNDILMKQQNGKWCVEE
ncbi:hypothetical protein HFP15_06680 [Amycolatopsis sp. K13G38]|uniref:DUF4878 domain-containing protein n=1 Tax=Amycolatopsis acididurans TaxID=2724524 RepID=A0ABX1IYI6_9PSEU|nr:hypothetical protein [Amycolatopsis acididurans]NKQ52562.1 hypothetical protein [Amycolatopsis acididurans]